MISGLKAALAISILLWHIVSGFVVSLFLRNPDRRLAFYVAATARHSRWTMRLFNICMKVEGAANLRPGQSYLIVSNHMSYLDAVLVASFHEVSFVSSVEMQQTPFLGTIMDMGGCIYVERRNKENIHNEIGQIEDTLKKGTSVVIFPEATSTNGEALRPFKRPLFTAAVKAARPVLPIVIQYESLDGKPVTRANRDSLCWYGAMSFAPHFFGLMKFRSIGIRLTVLPEIPVTNDSTRDTLMEQSQSAILGHYRPIV